jgi:very-short-patch-repair endonuclease
MEVKGDIQDLQKEEDERREKVLREMGLRNVRFRNDEVARNLSHRDTSRSAVGRIKFLLSEYTL